METDSKNSIYKINKTGFWESDDIANPWYVIRLKRHKIFVTNYTISTYHDGNFDYPKHIKVEGSYNSGPWRTLQDQNIGEDMHVYNKKLIYPLYQGIYDSFRFTMIGLNFAQTYLFVIYQLDFYGTLFLNGVLSYQSCLDRQLSRMSYFKIFFAFFLE